MILMKIYNLLKHLIAAVLYHSMSDQLSVQSDHSGF